MPRQASPAASCRSCRTLGPQGPLNMHLRMTNRLETTMKRLMELACALTVMFAPLASAQLAPGERGLEQVTASMAAALVEQDYSTAAALTYQPLVRAIGGREKAIEQMAATSNKLASEGVRLLAIKFDAPSVPFKVGNELHCVVPYTGLMKVPRGRLQIRSFYYAVSADGGKNWELLDGGRMNPETIVVLFPRWNGKPELPEKTKPQFIPSSD